MVDILSYRQFSPDALGEDDSLPEVDDFEVRDTKIDSAPMRR